MSELDWKPHPERLAEFVPNFAKEFGISDHAPSRGRPLAPRNLHRFVRTFARNSTGYPQAFMRAQAAEHRDADGNGIPETEGWDFVIAVMGFLGIELPRSLPTITKQVVSKPRDAESGAKPARRYDAWCAGPEGVHDPKPTCPAFFAAAGLDFDRPAAAVK